MVLTDNPGKLWGRSTEAAFKTAPRGELPARASSGTLCNNAASRFNILRDVNSRKRAILSINLFFFISNILCSTDCCLNTRASAEVLGRNVGQLVLACAGGRLPALVPWAGLKAL